MANPTVKEIVKKFLDDNGYDGLYNEDGECGCQKDDLFPCEFPYDDCIAGYYCPATEEKGDWLISAEKPETPLEAS